MINERLSSRRLFMITFRFLCPTCCVLALTLLSALNAFARDDYTNGFPSDPNFFPIGVWLQSPERALAYKAIGINTFVGLWKGPTEGQLAILAKNGLFAVANQNETGLQSSNRGVIKGWLHSDEPDNAQPNFFGLHIRCVPASEVVRRTERMKAQDRTRPIIINFGQGVANPYWRGRGLCKGDEDYYSIAARGADILSFDIYPVGSDTPQVKGRLEYVAHGVSRLVKLAGPGQKVWAIIETTALDPKLAVKPEQIRSEIWMAIIHGARGIVYFVHEFLPEFREDAIFRHPNVVKQVASENGIIESLANILNSPSIEEVVAVHSSATIATMTKRHDGKLYIFAVAMTNFPSRPQFIVQGVENARAKVLDERRSVTVTKGAFADSFEGYGVHIYEVPLTATSN